MSWVQTVRQISCPTNEHGSQMIVTVMEVSMRGTLHFAQILGECGELKSQVYEAIICWITTEHLQAWIHAG